jgi:hypothetical protein
MGESDCYSHYVLGLLFYMFYHSMSFSSYILSCEMMELTVEMIVLGPSSLSSPSIELNALAKLWYSVHLMYTEFITAMTPSNFGTSNNIC